MINPRHVSVWCEACQRCGESVFGRCEDPCTWKGETVNVWGSVNYWRVQGRRRVRDSDTGDMTTCHRCEAEALTWYPVNGSVVLVTLEHDSD